MAAAEVMVDQTYSTPAEHNNPMEPHATTAYWDGDRLTVYDSNQGATRVPSGSPCSCSGSPTERRPRRLRARRRRIRVQGQHPPARVLAAMAARNARPAGPGGAEPAADVLGGRLPHPDHPAGPAGRRADGRLAALDHHVFEQTSTLYEFAEQTAVVSRVMYAAPNLRTRHRLVALDVPTPSLDARPRRGAGDVRPGVGHGRAGGGVRRRPDRVADPQRARRRTRGRPPFQQPQPGGLPAGGRRPLRLGRPRPAPGVAPRRALADRDRGGRLDLPGAQHAVAPPRSRSRPAGRSG